MYHHHNADDVTELPYLLLPHKVHCCKKKKKREDILVDIGVWKWTYSNIHAKWARESHANIYTPNMDRYLNDKQYSGVTRRFSFNIVIKLERGRVTFLHFTSYFYLIANLWVNPIHPTILHWLKFCYSLLQYFFIPGHRKGAKKFENDIFFFFLKLVRKATKN